ncbi:MAG: hypothetical protein QG650_402, partial [Patescibacteria group bacterium]|nr:hypothetical protein [Patescibacteria group bacterium]
MPAKKTATEKAQKRTETETPPSSVSSFSHSVRAVFVQYLSDLKTTGREFAVPYRHFTHWNVSKLAIFLYSFAAGFVFSVPFLLAMGAIGYYALANPAGEATTTLLSRQSVTPSLIQMVLLENMGKVAAEVVLFAFVLTIFSVFITYGYYLLANVYRGYLENAELPLRANEYFHWK